MSALAYPGESTVFAGDRLALHVSTSQLLYRVAIFRIGRDIVHMTTTSARSGRSLPAGLPDVDWGWPPEYVSIPAAWSSGVYLALIIDGAEPVEPVKLAAADVDGRSDRALFVVRRHDVAASILYKLPLATYHAYNASGGGSIYNTSSFAPTLARTVVTMRRPGGGTGGDLSFPEAIDVYDLGTPREGFAHWDLPMIRWLEREGIAVEYCTDLDLHRDPLILHGYRLLVSAGHDEYWSAQMRRAVTSFVAQGGNVAFFCGNTSWWEIELTDNNAMSSVHPPVGHPRGGNWWRTEPENAMTGVSYRQGGGWWNGPREALGFTVQHPGHWVFDGLGLRAGDSFGAPERLVGYECDGAVLERGPDGFLRAAGTDGSPQDLAVLGVAWLGDGWQDRTAGAEANAVLGAFSNTGTVFTCGTTDWPRVLEAGEPVVAGVTRNVLARLVARGVRVLGPLPSRYGVVLAVAGAEATFQVAYDRPVSETTRFSWTFASQDGPAGPIPGGVTCTMRLPEAPGRFTVTVTVEDDDGQKSFGWSSASILSAAQAAQVDLLCQLRDLVIAASPSLKPTVEVGPGNRPFGDPNWDPVRDGLRTALSGEIFAEIEVRAGALAALAAHAAAFDATTSPTAIQ
ncbi:MAG: N,N-dimethylformamidase beta subunit family domain-containing protein [Actinomycetota bacterium]